MLVLAGNGVWGDRGLWVYSRRALLLLLSLLVLNGLLSALMDVRRTRRRRLAADLPDAGTELKPLIRLGILGASLAATLLSGASVPHRSRFSLSFAAVAAAVVLALGLADWWGYHHATPEDRAISEGSGGMSATLATLLLLLCVADFALGDGPVSPRIRLLSLVVLAALAIVARGIESALTHRRVRLASMEQALARQHRVMCSKGRSWANAADSERDGEWITGEILRQLDLKPGMKVADLGAGAGYFTRKLAERVGEAGVVYATDVDLWAAAKLRELTESSELSQIRPLHVDGRMPLPVSERVERLLMVNVGLFTLDEERHGRELLKDLATKILPGGKLVIHQQFVHEKGWRSAPELSGQRHSEPDAETLVRWAAQHFDLVDAPALPPPRQPYGEHEREGYLLVLQRR